MSSTGGASAGSVAHDQWLLDVYRVIDEARANRAAAFGGASVWEALVAAAVPDAEVRALVCARAGCAAANLADLPADGAALLEKSIALRYGVVPLRSDGAALLVATSNPLRLGMEEELAFASGRRVRLLVASPAEIRAAQELAYRDSAVAVEPEPTTTSRPAAQGDVPQSAAVHFIERMVGEALAVGASDIHIEPSGAALLVRFRVDGALYDAMRVQAELAALVVSRLKVSAGLDIADRMRPQDGRTSTTFAGRSVDLRVSTLPLGGTGEKVVLRLLDSKGANADLAALGFTPGELFRFRKQLLQPEGLVLVTGPTGSGKTTTLYSALKHVHRPESNIVTVEDPIEYRLAGINQVQTNDRAGLTFASALRSILRQDPDVVLVGEIRDAETTGIAIKASMTGHLVLSTLHTNDAAGAVVRLAELGADLGALAGALKAVVAQRLVRRFCPDCSRPAAVDEFPAEQQVMLVGRAVGVLRWAVGCTACRGTGYRGRMVVAEVLVVAPEMQRAIAHGASVGELGELAQQGGMHTLWEAGLERVLAGSTSLHELIDNVMPPPAALATQSASQSGVDALLQRLRRPAPAGTPPPTPAADRRARTHRVLIVNEDRAARGVLRTALEQDGFSVIEACDGEAARLYAERLRPDTVVTELALPRLDGIGLLQALATLPQAPPVVVCTAQADRALLAWARELGAADTLASDVDPRVLAARLRAAVGSAA